MLSMLCNLESESIDLAPLIRRSLSRGQRPERFKVAACDERSSCDLFEQFLLCRAFGYEQGQDVEQVDHVFCVAVCPTLRTHSV